jgi:hypothetical protein
MIKWNFATIAVGHPKWSWAAKRLCNQAFQTGLFSKITIGKVNPEIRRSINGIRLPQRLGYIFKGTKGLDSYRWKPLIIRKILQQIPDGEGLVYLDAGCELNWNDESEIQFKKYLSVAEETGLLTFTLNTSLFEGTQDSTLDFFNIAKELAQSFPMHQSGILFIIKNDKNMRLVERWRTLAIENPELFEERNMSNFVSSQFRPHRHDQSVLTCLFLNAELKGIPDETYHAPNWRRDGESYPIWAIRNSKLRSKLG